jgi:uncharacterized delta-60 repeat protein
MTACHRLTQGLLLVLFLVSILSRLTAAATRGRLDPSFKYKGNVVLTDFSGNSFEAAFALAIQSDGKIVAAGVSSLTANPDFAVARYEPNGRLDRRFGAGGKVVTDFSGTGSTDVASAFAIDSDGKIVVAGYSYASGRADADFALARYNQDGTLDGTFNFTGKVLTDVSGAGSTDSVSGVAIDSNGRIVVAGISNATGTSYDFALARYNVDGTLDTTFNGTGKVLTDFSQSGSADFAAAVVLQTDGKIVVAGLSDARGLGYDFALARYKTDGTLDGTFNGIGRVLTDFSGTGGVDAVTAVAIDSNDKIVAAGYSSASGTFDVALARYNHDGSLDVTFNETGKVLADLGSQDQANGVAIQADGKIVAAGQSTASDGRADFAVSRYNVDGTLDVTFNSTGAVVTDVGGFDVAYAVAIQPDGKILTSGYSDVSGTSDFAIARYLP